MRKSASVRRGFQNQKLSCGGTLYLECIPHFCGGGRNEKMAHRDSGWAITILETDISIAAAPNIGEGNIWQSMQAFCFDAFLRIANDGFPAISLVDFEGGIVSGLDQ